MLPSLVKKSRCVTCQKSNGHVDIMGSAEATQHQDHYPDHRVQQLPDEEQAPIAKGPRKLAPALVIPKPSLRMNGYSAYVTSDLYDGPLEARLSFPVEDFDIVWPASHDADGFYSVSE